MFRRARIHLTATYIAMFALVLGLFSLVFYVGFATVLEPTFDIKADLTNEQVAEAVEILKKDPHAHYDAHCPKCRRSTKLAKKAFELNPVTKKMLEG